VSLARLAQPLLGVLWQQPPVRLRGRPAESGDRVAWPRRRGTRRPRLHCDPSESLLIASPDHYQLGMKILADYVRWERPNQLTPPRPHLGRLTLYLLPRLQCRDGGGKVRPLLPARQRPPHNAQLAGDLLIAVGVLKAQRRRPPHLLHCRRQVARGADPAPDAARADDWGLRRDRQRCVTPSAADSETSEGVIRAPPSP
jgi:hypothetical protein